MFTQFEEGDLLSETRADTEIGNVSDDNSTLSPLICEEEMGAKLSGDESDAEPIYTDMLEDILDGNQSHSIIYNIEVRYNIRYCIKQGQVECKGALLSIQTWVKVYRKYLRLLLIIFYKLLKIWVVLAQKFLNSF